MHLGGKCESGWMQYLPMSFSTFSLTLRFSPVFTSTAEGLNLFVVKEELEILPSKANNY